MTSTDSNKKKKLLDRKTEEAVSLAQKSSCSDLIPLWCKAPEDISPPETVPLPSPSEATPLRPLRPFHLKQVHPRGEKRIRLRRRRKHTHNSPWGPNVPTGVQGLLQQKQGWWSVHPGKNKHQYHPKNSPWSPPLHVI